MIKKFLYLEWKNFLRSASFASNMALKILMAFIAIYFTLVFLALGIGTFYILQKMNLNPIATVNKFLIYYFLFDLIIRLLLQKIPVMNIRPLLVFPIKRASIVHFSLGKTALSFFNFVHAFFFLPFSIVLIYEGYDILSVILWHTALFALVYCNNFANILLSNKDRLFTVFIGIVAVFGVAQYYNYFDITRYSSPFFSGLFHTKWLFIVPLTALLLLYYFTFTFFKKNLYLDAGLATKSEIAKTENLTWLNQFGTLGTFLKNDIKLIKNNYRIKHHVSFLWVVVFHQWNRSL